MINSSASILNINETLASWPRAEKGWSEPENFDLNDANDEQRLLDAFDNGRVSMVHDSAHEIADDLFELHHPDMKGDDVARAEFVATIIEQGPKFGRWFLMGWSGELVRFPDVEEHRALRTSRNRDLVTAEEQAELYDSTIAVCGLSVGSNVLGELVMSGIGGKLVTADMDVLTPSNLNRIKGDFTDVGSAKVDIMAKKISRIDPYIDQVHLREGVTSENLDELVSGQNRPDILVDEVDDLGMKVVIRHIGRREGIPVVMATDLGDRSILDVERYDQNDAEPFHGKLKDREIDTLLSGELSDDEKKKFMAKIVGLTNVTPRLIHSVMQVGKSLPGMPQLGVTAAVGGAMSAIAAREIILGRKLPSGRYIYNPKKILGLQSPTGKLEGIKTFIDFARSKK